MSYDRKICSKCKKAKRRNAFRPLKNGKNNSDSLRAECRMCLAKRARKWRKKNPDYGKLWKRSNKELDSLYQWRGALKKKYGLSEEQYEQMLEACGRVCSICRRGFMSRPNVDHCHQTGKVRGLLCKPCNRGLGMFGDDLVRLKAAVSYLEDFVDAG